MPKYSIIVPVYCAEGALKRCIDSVLAQTYRDFELVLVDDGSPDDSGKICDEYTEKDARVKVIHKENGGVSSARNRGIEVATGERILFVDADDYISQTTLEKIESQLKINDVDIICFSHYIINGKTQQKYNVTNTQLETRELINTISEIEGAETILCTIWNKVYKTEIIKGNALIFRLGMKFGEDFLFNSQYYLHARNISVFNEALYCYDTSGEQSAVKKIYPEMANYILSMQESFFKLLDKYAPKNKKSAEYVLKFINDRWDYAGCLCTTSSLPLSKKSMLINNWVATALTSESLIKKQNLFYLYAKQYQKRGSISDSFVRKMGKKLSNKTLISQIKSLIKNTFSR